MQLLQEYFLDLISPEWAWHLVSLNILISSFYLFIFKFKIGWLSGVNVHDELSEKDNPAFGIVLGSLFFSFFLIMSAASTGNDIIPIKDEIILMLSYGIAGIIMLFISKILLDKIIFSGICLPSLIRQRNLSAAIIDGTNAIATALIVFTYMGWVKGTSLESIKIVSFGWIMSQILLSLYSFFKIKLHQRKSSVSFEDSIKNNNIAVAIRYSAYKISFAMTPMIAAPHYPYESEHSLWYASAIFISSVLLSIIIFCFTKLLIKLIFTKIDMNNEINNQNNYGISFAEACFAIGITILFYGLIK